MTSKNNEPSLIGIYGAGGCGRSIMPVASQLYTTRGCRLVFVDDADLPGLINGHATLSFRQFREDATQNKAMAIAIADGQIRRKIAVKMAQTSIQPLSLTHPSCVIMHDVDIGQGHLLSPFVTLTSNIRIGKFFHANLYSYVEHDCVIGDFVTFAPGVKCNGNVIIEDHAYIGAGAIIRQGTQQNPLIIGKGATVGMGAVVTRSVAAGDTVIGNPARPLRK